MRYSTTPRAYLRSRRELRRYGGASATTVLRLSEILYPVTTTQVLSCLVLTVAHCGNTYSGRPRRRSLKLALPPREGG